MFDENIGDLILTQAFRQSVNKIGFEAVFCRKSNPESKGKIENVSNYSDPHWALVCPKNNDNNTFLNNQMKKEATLSYGNEKCK